MGKLDLLRKIIREELRTVLKEELSILNESRTTTSSFKQDLKNKVESKVQIPGTLNTAPRKINTSFGDDPLGKILTETAHSMQQEFGPTHNFTTDNIFDFTPQQSTSLGSVQGMLASSRPSSNLEMIEIKEVPDYSAFMEKLLNDKK